MKAARAILFAFVGTVAAGAAGAQRQQATAGPGAAGGPLGFGGEVGAIGPQHAPSQPRPLFSIFGLPVGIWAPVPPPYNVAANRNLASRPIE
ncbi:MAG TPA: hypothetical protein VH855_14475 [Acetobacteraceae bacterium]|jgi:hypothetical protein